MEWPGEGEGDADVASVRVEDDLYLATCGVDVGGET